MGHMRFHTPDHSLLSQWQADCAYVCGMDGMPWRSHNSLADGLLTLDRESPDSGNLNVPWTTEAFGQSVLSTASLRETEIAYHLPLELARGTLNRLRMQKADWELAGMTSPPELDQSIREATSLFVDAATQYQVEPQTASELSRNAIEQAAGAIKVLCAHYAEQAIAVRRGNGTKLPTLLSCALDQLPANPEIHQQITQSFNSVSIPFRWKDIEPNAGEYQWDEVDRQIKWCQAKGLRICAGPLVRLDRFSLPDWIYLWEDDFEQLANFALQFVNNVVKRYQGKVHLWQCVSGLNVNGEVQLKEEQRLRLAVGGIDTVRRLDPQTPTVASFDQPWGEYLASEYMELSPLQFADTLMRADLGLAGVGLEINMGYWPNGTLPRDPLALSRLIDRWSILGFPLLTVMSCPDQTERDPRADSQIDNVAGRNLQAEMAQMIEVLLAKPSVHGVIWNQLTDSALHRFPHSGVFDANFKPKPVLAEIAAIRKAHLM